MLKKAPRRVIGVAVVIYCDELILRIMTKYYQRWWSSKMD